MFGACCFFKLTQTGSACKDGAAFTANRSIRSDLSAAQNKHTNYIQTSTQQSLTFWANKQGALWYMHAKLYRTCATVYSSTDFVVAHATYVILYSPALICQKNKEILIKGWYWTKCKSYTSDHIPEFSSCLWEQEVSVLMHVGVWEVYIKEQLKSQ